ncbi:unnamed protein product [Rotaria socialis]|uniref:SWIM-type domain-containing protein n=1 Tax=Rotaria socialis TaxID=392032 RepID=A0A818VI79_9BILA|nr:unnamed protein product [Rotaria socialis]CAF4877632.1 unnamed protein product [Rotaria socialis]
MPDIKCNLCNCWRNSSELKSLCSSTYSWYHEYLLSNGKTFNVNELFSCKGCTKALYTMKKDLSIVSISHSSESFPELMEINDDNDGLTLDNITFIGSGHKRCVVLYAPHGIRSCTSHLLNGDRLRPDEHIDIENRFPIPTSLSSTEASELFSDLFSLIDELRSSSHLDFDSILLTDEDYQAWTGWTKEQFNLMFQYISSHLRSSSNRTSRNAFASFWIKLKTNLSFRQIGSLFNMIGDSELRRKRASDTFDSVRELLMLHFVSAHLGIGHITIDEAKIHNTAYTKDIIRIICTGLNCCRGAMFINASSPYHQKLAQIMRIRVSSRSILQQLVDMGAISSRSRCKKKIEDVDFEFPQLSLDDLHVLFLSSYKIKLAPAYVEEHLDKDGDYIIGIGDDNDFILRCTIQSRHSNAVKYKTWIQYSLTGEPIVAWYCTCTAGAMTLGSCSHVVSIIWYLSYARHHDFQVSQGRHRIQQAVMERTIESEGDVEEIDSNHDEED